MRRIALAFLLCATPLAAQSVKLVTVSCPSSTLALGARMTCTTVVRLANGTYTTTRPITWASSNPNVALVSAKGVVSTIAAGSATIGAIVGPAKGDAAITVTSSDTSRPVTHAVASVTVSLAAPSIANGAATQATAIPRDSAGDPVAGRTVGWSSLAPSVASVGNTGVVAALTEGTATIRATVDAKVGNATVSVTAAPTPPPADTTLDVQAPSLLTTTLASTPSAGRSLTVASGGNLQAALDSARWGDNITLACGAKYSGNYVLGVKTTGTGWVTLKSACATPAQGTRVQPSTSFTRLSSPNGLQVLTVAAGATKWRVIGLELTNDSTLTSSNGLVELGDGQATSNAQHPRNIILDRVYVHSWPAQWIHRCIAINGDSLAVLDSYVSECHADIDAQALASYGGNGPYKIVNNYLEGSTETLGIGGADPRIANLVPSDIEIRGNHITRQMSWKGGPWLEKNLVEMKFGRRVWIVGNVLENAWPHAQSGWAFVLWSVNQQGSCTWCILSDVLVEKNLIRNVSAGFQLNPSYDFTNPAMRRVTIQNNVFIGLANAAVGDGGYGFLTYPYLTSALTIDHNTLFNPHSVSWMWSGGSPAPLPHHVVTNNLTGGNCGTYAQVSMAGAFSSITTNSSSMLGNVIACFDNYTNYIPAGNFFPVSLAAVGLAGGAGAAYSVTATLDSLALTTGSTYHNAATDNTDVGADIPAVKAATAGVTALGATRTP